MKRRMKVIYSSSPTPTGEQTEPSTAADISWEVPAESGVDSKSNEKQAFASNTGDIAKVKSQKSKVKIEMLAVTWFWDFAMS